MSCSWSQTLICIQHQETPSWKECPRRLQSFNQEHQCCQKGLWGRYRQLSLGLGEATRLIRQPWGATWGKASANSSTNAENSGSSPVHHPQQVWSRPGVAMHTALIIHASQPPAMLCAAWAPRDKGRREKKGALHRNFHALGSVN